MLTAGFLVQNLEWLESFFRQFRSISERRPVNKSPRRSRRETEGDRDNHRGLQTDGFPIPEMLLKLKLPTWQFEPLGISYKV